MFALKTTPFAYIHTATLFLYSCLTSDYDFYKLINDVAVTSGPVWLDLIGLSADQSITIRFVK